MQTPPIQTLLTDAQQVLNLNSLSEIRATTAAALACANVGDPLNPALTTQQLWNEFYEIVRQPESDIESIITQQLMKFLYFPPAPGGVGADKQVIFNDVGLLAGDAGLTYNKTTDALTVGGNVQAASATITGDLTVATTALKVVSASNRVLINQASAIQGDSLEISAKPDGGTISLFGRASDNASILAFRANGAATQKAGIAANDSGLRFQTGTVDRYAIDTTGVSTWSVGGSTAMTLNSTGLGVGVVPYVSWPATSKALQLGASSAIEGRTNDGSRITVYSNTVWNGTNLIYQNTAPAAYYQQAVGVHSWHTNSNTPLAGNPATFTQAMTLDASGNLLVGTTTAGAKITALAGASGQAAIFQQPAQNFWCVLAHNQATSGDNSFVLFGTEASFTSRGSITYNRAAGQVSYNITSDYRLKEDVKPLTGALNRISSLKPSTYKFKETGFTCEGFIAHELAEVIPAAVTGEKDAVNEDGSIKAQGVDLSKVVPVLVSAIQELTARVQTLEAK